MVLFKEEFIKRASLISNKNYTQQLGYFTKLLRKTRLPYLKYNGFFMGAMQMNMLDHLFAFQETISTSKKQILGNITSKERSFLNEKILITKEWIRVFQTISDGIAWRNLKFNRPILRLFSENMPAGHLKQVDQDYVSRLKSYLGKIPNFVIVNDLTRCLRVSDLTRIFPSGRILLYEIKKSGKRVKDIDFVLTETIKHKRFFSKQELKQWVVQSAIMDKKINIPALEGGKIKDNLKAEIVDSNFKIKTHFRSIKKLIRKADKHGYSQLEVEKGYFIEIFAHDQILKKEDPPKELKLILEETKKNIPSWVKDKTTKIITLSNYDSFIQENGQYARNFTP